MTAATDSLEAQALEVVPEDLYLIGSAFPVWNVQRPEPSAAARVQLIRHGGIGWGAARDEHLRTLDEGQLAQHGVFIQSRFFLAFPVEREVRVHQLFPGTEGRRA